MHSLPEAVVFAFSGTLVDTSVIGYLIAGHHPACDAPGADRFQREAVLCQPVKQVLQLLNLERSIGRRVVILSESRDHYRPHAEAWLDRNGVHADEIHFRQVSDHRPDALTKRDLMSGIQRDFHVVHAYENRPDVARAFGRLGLNVTLTSRGTRESRAAFAA